MNSLYSEIQRRVVHFGVSEEHAASIFRVSQAITQHEVSSKQLHACSLLRILFSPEDGSDMFLRNFDRLSTDFEALYAEGKTSC